MKKKCTISVFTENHVGLLNRVTIIFTRRKINIESITASQSEVEGVHRYTIVVNEDETLVEKVIKQLEKQVEILAAFYHLDNELYAHELGIFKVQNTVQSEVFIQNQEMKVLDRTAGYIVVEKTGSSQEIMELKQAFEEYGLLEFVKSGRLAITKPMTSLDEYLEVKREAYI